MKETEEKKSKTEMRPRKEKGDICEYLWRMGKEELNSNPEKNQVCSPYLSYIIWGIVSS